MKKLIKYSLLSFISIILFLFIVMLIVSDKDFNKPDKYTTEYETKKPKSKITTYDFNNGNYTSGKHFEPGIYDITCSGNGNVSSSNMFTGGINIISPNEAKNIKLPKGTELKISSISENLNVHLYKK